MAKLADLLFELIIFLLLKLCCRSGTAKRFSLPEGNINSISRDCKEQKQDFSKKFYDFLKRGHSKNSPGDGTALIPGGRAYKDSESQKFEDIFPGDLPENFFRDLLFIPEFQEEIDQSCVDI